MEQKLLLQAVNEGNFITVRTLSKMKIRNKTALMVALLKNDIITAGYLRQMGNKIKRNFNWFNSFETMIVATEWKINITLNDRDKYRKCGVIKFNDALLKFKVLYEIMECKYTPTINKIYIFGEEVFEYLMKYSSATKLELMRAAVDLKYYRVATIIFREN